MFFTIGIPIVAGLTVSGINKLIYRINGRGAYRFIMATSIIGTPIHELGHAFFALVFNHKIHKICLLNRDKSSGVLGYVSMSYKKGNLYEKIGDFFIGIGPIIFGTVFLIASMWLLVPNVCENIISDIRGFKLTSVNNFVSGEFYLKILRLVWDAMLLIFAPKNFTNILWWIFIALALSMAAHMDLSVADIKISKSGILFCCIFGATLLGVSYLIDLLFDLRATLTLVEGSIYLGFYFSLIFTVVIIFGLFLALLAWLFKLIRR